MVKNYVKASLIVGLVISLILVGTLLPIGLDDLVDYNGSYTNSSGDIVGYNTTVATLVSTVLPIIGVIVILMGFISWKSN